MKKKIKTLNTQGKIIYNSIVHYLEGYLFDFSILQLPSQMFEGSEFHTLSI